jgi:hypothetical protein
MAYFGANLGTKFIVKSIDIFLNGFDELTSVKRMHSERQQLQLEERKKK